jgi:YD repeat-containing protein
MTHSTLVGRGRRRARLALLSLSTILAGGVAASPALAQLAPVRQSVDANGVDLFYGTLAVNGPAISVGSGEQGMTYYKVNVYGTNVAGTFGWIDNLTGVMNVDSAGNLVVTVGNHSNSFTVSGSTYTATEGDGATLTVSGNISTYTAHDGTVAHFNGGLHSSPYGGIAQITDVTRPDGQKMTYGYDTIGYCTPLPTTNSCQHLSGTVYRIAAVTSNLGYRAVYSYPTVPYTTGGQIAAAWVSRWETPNGIALYNLATSPSAPLVSTTGFTDALGNATTYGAADDGTGLLVVGSITRPGSTSPDETISYTSGRVSSVTTAAGTWTYGAPSDVSGVRTVTVTDPLSHTTTYTFDIAAVRMKSMTNALPTPQTWSWLYDTNGRVTDAIWPEGNKTHYTYDANGNVTEVRQVSKTPGAPADIVTSAHFPTSTNPVIANQPDWTKDANSNETDYTYNSSGQALTVTAPAAAIGGVRPVTTYGYTSYQSYYWNNTAFAASGAPISMLTSVSQCQTGASCAGTADEAKTVIAYGPQVTGTGNNLLPVTVTKEAGDGTIPATTTYGYDNVGNVTTVDGPLAGTDDTTTYRYDGDRNRVGTIAPDPDGAGTRKRAAERVTYDVKSRPTLDELGVVAGTDDTSWAAFAPSQATATTYDGVDRTLTTTLKSGSTIYGITQSSYDHQRLDCTAVRMNSATWGTLPASACTAQTTGSAGPDRITELGYDAADQVLTSTSAVGSAHPIVDATGTYTNNGKLQTLKDANGNLTTYSYDGFDRVIKTAYPSPTVPGASSTTDYEAPGYDPQGNVTSLRLRDGTSIGYGYDHRNELTTKTLPNGELAVTYGYDLLNRRADADVRL